MPASANPEKPLLAFLGPLGTYSHQAAFECFGNSVEYLPQPTIAEVHQILSPTVPFGIVPQENSINGSVVETYNVLRDPVVGQETFVRGTTIFAVRHSLVTRREVKLENIEKILSHEQALGQCRGWLTEHLPRASLVCTDSTADAAKRLLSPQNELDTMKCAAICSPVVVTIHKGLQILEENIQDRKENFTRFYILSQGLDVAFPERRPPSTESLALIRFQAPPNGLTKSMLNIPRVIGTLDITVERIDRRPSVCANSRPFDDVYFLELGATPGRNSPELPWISQVQQAVERAEHMGVEASILGCW